MSMGRYILLFVAVGLFLDPIQAEDRLSPSFARSGGVYASGALGGALGMLNTFRAGPDDDINARLRAGRAQGLINVVQLNYGHRWNEDREGGMVKLKEWLERTELSLVDIVHLAEEQPYNAATWLDPLYQLIKAHDPTLPVYVWPSYPLGPMGLADGYVYDAYGEGYMASRRRIRTFLDTGKPLIMCVDASGYSDYALAREQLMACFDLNVPVFYFAADSGRGSVNNWLGKPTLPLATCRNFLFAATEFQRQCREVTPLASGDLVWGDIIEVAPDDSGNVRYTWTGAGPATVYGYRRLSKDGATIHNTSENVVTLEYPFWSLFPVMDGGLVLFSDKATSSASGVEVAYSRCGKADTWKSLAVSELPDGEGYRLGDVGQEFRLRLRLAPGAVLGGGKITGTGVLPTDRAIPLDTYFDGWRKKILFHQAMKTGLWRAVGQIDAPGVLVAEETAPTLRGVAGRGVRVSVVEKFTSDLPLEGIQVRLSGMSQQSLGGAFSLGVSLDGEEILAEGFRTSEPRADGKYEGDYALDLGENPAFTNVRSFYVHMTQRNSSGIQGNISSRLKALEIEATPVSPN